MYQYIKSGYWKHWAASLSVTLVTAAFMMGHDFFEVPSLMQIEFADSAAVFHELTKQFRIPGSNPLYWNSMLDFIFMIAYTSLFYFSARVLFDLFELKPHRIIAILFVPFLLDFIENMLLLQMMGRPTDDYFSFSLFYWTVRLKWAFVIPGIILSLVVFLYQLYVGIDRLYCWWADKRG